MKKTWKRLCTGFLALATVVTALPTMDNRKTKSAAFFRASFITLIKPFKYVFQIFLLNSHSIIRQQQLHVIFLL